MISVFIKRGNLEHMLAQAKELPETKQESTGADLSLAPSEGPEPCCTLISDTKPPQLEGSKCLFKAIYCHPAYLTYTHSTSCETPGWMNHKLESRLPGEISTI